LGGHGQAREVVTPGQFGMPQDESRAQGEGDQEKQGHCGKTMVGNQFSPAGSLRAAGERVGVTGEQRRVALVA
jgi:hypothetical protein